MATRPGNNTKLLWFNFAENTTFYFYFFSGVWANKKDQKTEFKSPHLKSFIDSLLQGANLQDRSKF